MTILCFENKQKRPFLRFRIFKWETKNVWHSKLIYYLSNLFYLLIKILLCSLGIRKKNLLCAQSAMTRKITFKTDKSLPDKNAQ